MTWLRPTLVIAISVMISGAGCSGGDSGPATYPVTGTVELNGQAVADASLTFHPQGEGTPAQAETDDGGQFSVSTYFDLGKRQKPGMTPGKYTVTIAKLDLESIRSTGQPPKNLLPPKYDSQRTSGLEATVTAEGPNEYQFELSR